MRKNEDRVAVYSRKSRFTGRGESIGNQVELSREYIRAHYGDACAESMIVFEDEGFSGGDLRRPGFMEMMQAAGEHRFRAIVVYRLDRISRNVSDFSGLIEELSRLGIDFVSIREQFDTGTPMGRAMMYIASVFSQLERETIAERIRDNMHELAKTGRWLGGTTPTGYVSESVRSVTVDGKTKKSCNLRLLPGEAETVRLIYALYTRYGSLTRTEAELMQRGIKSKNGKAYTRFSVRGILQNPVYAAADGDSYAYFREQDAELFSEREDFDGAHGILAYNRTDQEKGRATQWRPVSEWIVTVGRHPGLVSGREWVSVQEALARGGSKTWHQPRGNRALLTGILSCACGSRMYPRLTKRLTAAGEPAFSYACKRRERSRGDACGTENVSGNVLDAAILERIAGLPEDRGAFAEQLARSRGCCAAGQSGQGRLDALRRGRAETEKKLSTLVDSFSELADGDARAPVAARIEQLERERQRLADGIRELEDQHPQCTLDDGEFEALRGRLSGFGSCVAAMDVGQRRAAVRAVVRGAVWDGETARVFLFGAPDDTAAGPAKLLRREDSK